MTQKFYKFAKSINMLTAINLHIVTAIMRYSVKELEIRAIAIVARVR